MSESGTERTGPSRSMVSAGVVVAIIVALGLILTISNLLGGSGDPAAAPGPSASPGRSSSSPGSLPAVPASVCGLDDAAETGTLTKAPAATWSLVGTTAAPTLTGAGPGRVDEDGYRSCFARTPVGATLAAANFVAMGSVVAIQHKVTDLSVVPGPGRDRALARPVSGGGKAVRIQVAGVRVLRYTGTSADVDLAIRTSSGALAGQVFNLRWSAGDWKVELGANGDLLTPIVQLPDLAGYIPWAGA